jgi:hypothetical protein
MESLFVVAERGVNLGRGDWRRSGSRLQFGEQSPGFLLMSHPGEDATAAEGVRTVAQAGAARPVVRRKRVGVSA